MKNILGYKLVLTGLFLALAVQTGFANAEQTAAVAVAKKQEPLTVALTAKKVLKDAKGKETFLSANKVKPGEVIEYRANYANISKATLNGVIATLPVPKGMIYVDKSANPAVAMATVDDIKTVANAKYEAVPLMRKVKDKTGKEVVQLVPVSEYRALRWSLGEIQAGKVKTISARVSVAK